MTADSLLEFSDVHKRYGAHHALRGLSLSVPSGTGAPVMTRTAVPTLSDADGRCPARTVSATGNTTGDDRFAAATSAARTA